MNKGGHSSNCLNIRVWDLWAVSFLVSRANDRINEAALIWQHAYIITLSGEHSNICNARQKYIFVISRTFLDLLIDFWTKVPRNRISGEILVQWLLTFRVRFIWWKSAHPKKSSMWLDINTPSKYLGSLASLGLSQRASPSCCFIIEREKLSHVAIKRISIREVVQ